MKFHKWITSQKDDNSPIGDLANDIISDSTFPKDTNSLKKVRLHLMSKGACRGALNAFDEVADIWKDMKRNFNNQEKQ